MIYKYKDTVFIQQNRSALKRPNLSPNPFLQQLCNCIIYMYLLVADKVSLKPSIAVNHILSDSIHNVNILILKI